MQDFRSFMKSRKKFGDSEEFKKWDSHIPDPFEPGHPYYESHPEIFDPNYSEDGSSSDEEYYKEYFEEKQAKADKLNQISAAINGAKQDAKAYGGERQGLPEDMILHKHPDGWDSYDVAIVSEADLNNDKTKDPIFGMPPEDPTARAVSDARDAHNKKLRMEEYARNASLGDIKSKFKPRMRLFG